MAIWPPSWIIFYYLQPAIAIVIMRPNCHIALNTVHTCAEHSKVLGYFEYYLEPRKVTRWKMVTNLKNTES